MMISSTQPEETPAIKILIADDKPAMRQAFKNLLYFEEGFKVIGMAEDGQAAIEQAGLLNPDVILMDIEMPVMDGLTATRNLRGRQPAPCIIAMSSDMRYKSQALAAGAIAFLVKPFTSEEITSTILKSCQS